MNLDFLYVVGGVRSRRPDVIFDVAGAEDAARIDILESRNDFVRRLASGVNHYVEAAAMTHGHDRLDGAVFAGGVEQMHEIGADGSAVITASFLRVRASELPEVGRGDWLEKAQRVQIRFEISPAAVGVEHSFTVGRGLGRSSVAILGRGLLFAFFGLGGAGRTFSF